VFLERQYCRFAGIAHGRKSDDFIDRLVQRGFARVEATRHLYQGRFYHLHHKRLYSLIGQTDNRNRKRAHRSRMIERLVLLDIVLDDRGVARPVRPRATVCVGRSRPAVSMSDEARVQSSPPANPPENRHRFDVRFDAGSGFTWTAITSGSVRARRGAVQGSPLRSDRALCARLARVGVASWRAVAVSERETLTAPLSERVALAIA
jgi:hypothetical protein